MFKNIIVMSMCFTNNQLMVNSDQRASYFDLDGNFIKEEIITKMEQLNE